MSPDELASATLTRCRLTMVTAGGERLAIVDASGAALWQQHGFKPEPVAVLALENGGAAELHLDLQPTTTAYLPESESWWRGWWYGAVVGASAAIATLIWWVSP